MLAVSQAPPKRNMGQIDALRSASQAAKASTKLRVAIVLKVYEPDKTAKFFVKSAYNHWVWIEFFADLEESRKWLGLDGEQVN